MLTNRGVVCGRDMLPRQRVRLWQDRNRRATRSANINHRLPCSMCHLLASNPPTRSVPLKSSQEEPDGPPLFDPCVVQIHPINPVRRSEHRGARRPHGGAREGARVPVRLQALGTAPGAAGPGGGGWRRDEEIGLRQASALGERVLWSCLPRSNIAVVRLWTSRSYRAGGTGHGRRVSIGPGS